jgi:protein-glutamine gamma-glutamyltransferase
VKRRVDLTTLRPLVWAAVAFAAGVLLNADRVPSWVPVAALLLAAWRVWVGWRPTRSLRLPGTLARTALAMLLVVAVLVRFHTFNGLSAGTALLMLMGAGKLLETSTRRDELIVVGASLFLLLAACLDRQELLRAPLYLVHVWICCAGVAVIAYAPPLGSARESRGGMLKPFDDRSALLLAGRTLLLAAPLALVLFVFFPRMAGAFWALPRTDVASTGLSDSMSPGSITQLVASYDTAFRVRFEGAVPPPEQRYWRGPVLYDFDGSTWRRRFSFWIKQPLSYTGRAYRYHISLEPSSERWWFVLDTLKEKPEGQIFVTADNEVIARDPPRNTTTYTATSVTDVRSTSKLAITTRQRDTAPIVGNPRSKTFARELRDRSGSDGAYVAAVLSFLRTGGFEYTTSPPPLGINSIDDFLFSTRQGFCGHFASSFVGLMRDAGVPAHVVTGYLGGEWNPIGGYFIVRQSDAHAWAEVWLDGHGWTRVDPTAAVEPGRLTRGMLDLLPDAGSAPARLIRRSVWLTGLLQRWDAANQWWSEHVVKFDLNMQLSILQRLGFESPDVRQLGWAFAAGLLVWMLWMAWQFGRRAPSSPPDRLSLAYSRLCRKLAASGIDRAPYQGPLAYADAVTASRPDLAGPIRPLLEEYARLRFGRSTGDASEVFAFERDVKRLRVDSQA